MKIEEVEKGAYRAQLSPWLWDLFLSGVVVLLGLFVGYNRGADGVPGLVVFGLAMLGWVGLMKWAQWRVVRPRVGEAVFGRRRRKRIHRTIWVLVGSVILGILLLIWTPWLLGLGVEYGRGFWLLAIFGVQAILVFGLLGYLQDYPAGYGWGWIFALVIPSVEWGVREWGLHLPVFAIAVALVMGFRGILGLRHFLQEYPLCTEELDWKSNGDQAG